VIDWKQTSHFLTYMAHKFGAALSTPDSRNGFQLVGSQAFVPVEGLDHKFNKVTPKSVRRWLWEVRYNPIWRDPDVLVYIERESPTSWWGRVGKVGSPDHEQAIVFTEAE
jgi:hypothetical protein